MKLDIRVLRYMTSEEIRVLTAVEMGSKNHEVVPTSLIISIAGLRHGGAHKLLGDLAKRNLVARVKNTAYDGFRLTYGGYDYLALKTFAKKGSIYSVGNQIGVGKESDIYVVANEDGTQNVLKLHRLGRISFRAIKEKRDYLGKRKSASWMYMSRLAATKEFAFMKVLGSHGFPVPKAIDQSRHCIVMSLIDASPLRNVAHVLDPGKLYSDLMNLIVRLASYGLVHGDFNEFNILVKDDGTPILIDFPQMVSTSHADAEYYFNRDVDCIRTYFKKRYNYESLVFPRFSTDGSRESGLVNLDVEVAASGYSVTKEQAERLRQYFEDNRDARNDHDIGELSEEEDEEVEEEDEDDGDGDDHDDSRSAIDGVQDALTTSVA